MRSTDSQQFPILASMDDLPIPKSRRIDRIYIHHSWSRLGDAEEIHKWHLERGFSGIGYNAAVNIGDMPIRPDVGFPAGIIQLGRNINKMPAQVRGDNSHSIGICVIGNFDTIDENRNPGESPNPGGDREKAVALLAATYCRKLNLPVRQVLGHREAKYVPGVPDPHKSCPGDNVNCDLMRMFIWQAMHGYYGQFNEWYNQLVESFRADYPDYKFTS